MTEEELRDSCASSLKAKFEDAVRACDYSLCDTFFRFYHGVRRWVGYICPSCNTVVTMSESEMPAAYNHKISFECPECGKKKDFYEWDMKDLYDDISSVCAMMLTDGDNFVYGKCDLSTYPMCEVSDAKPLSKITSKDIRAMEKYTERKHPAPVYVPVFKTDSTDWGQFHYELFNTFYFGINGNTMDIAHLHNLQKNDKLWCAAFVFLVKDKAVKRILHCNNRRAIAMLTALFSEVTNKDVLDKVKSLILPVSKLTEDRLKNGNVFRLPMDAIDGIGSYRISVLAEWVKIREDLSNLNDEEFMAEFNEANIDFDVNDLKKLRLTLRYAKNLSLSQITDICLVRRLFSENKYTDTLPLLMGGFMPAVDFQLYGPSLKEWKVVFNHNRYFERHEVSASDQNIWLDTISNLISNAKPAQKSVEIGGDTYTFVDDVDTVISAGALLRFSLVVMSGFYKNGICFLYYDTVNKKYVVIKNTGKVLLKF